jgi:HD domain
MQPDLATAPIAIRPLPSSVSALLETVHAPPRLVAHLALVHEVAAQLISRIDEGWPSIEYDRETVLIGCATHDIGKVIFREELTAPGTRHEEVGEGILLEHGFSPRSARFARTHGGPGREPHMQFEDWLVMLADHIWKGVRDQHIEDELSSALARATHSAPWEIYLVLDDILVELSGDADQRLAWHGIQLA